MGSNRGVHGLDGVVVLVDILERDFNVGDKVDDLGVDRDGLQGNRLAVVGLVVEAWNAIAEGGTRRTANVVVGAGTRDGRFVNLRLNSLRATIRFVEKVRRDNGNDKRRSSSLKSRQTKWRKS